MFISEEKESLKMVFKLGGGNKEQSPDVYSQSSHDEKRHKHKKKKKRNQGTGTRIEVDIMRYGTLEFEP